MSSSSGPIDLLLEQFLLKLRERPETSFDVWVQGHPDEEPGLRAAWEDWQRAAQALAGSPSGEGGERLGPGSRLGEFTLIELLGRGAQGSVWAAEQAALGRTVALKVLRAERVSERERALFQREARAGARLQHPGIVTVYDSGDSDGVYWIAQELIEGGRTLRQWIDETRNAATLPRNWYATCAEIVESLARALANAHEAGIVHRDLKPQNVLLTREGAPLVSDFGLARVDDTSAFSQSGEQVGTYLYMSPEQVTAKRSEVDHRSDVFSLGVVLYELLTLQRPFDGDTAHQICSRVLHYDPPEPRTLRSNVPLELSVICGKAMEKERARRYASMSAFAEDVRRFLSDRPILARPPTVPARAAKWLRRHPTVSAVTGVSVLATVTLSFLLAENRRANQELERTNTELGVREESLRVANESLSQKTREATQEAEKKQVALRFMTDIFDMGDPDRSLGESVSVKDVLDQTGRLLTHSRAAEDATVHATLLHSVGRVYMLLGLLREAETFLTKAMELRRQHLAAIHPELLDSLHNIGMLHVWRGNAELGARYLSQVAESRESALGRAHVDTRESKSRLGFALVLLQRLDEAERVLQEVIDGGRNDAPGVAALQNLGNLWGGQGRYEDALILMNEALTTRQSSFPARHPRVISTKYDLAGLHKARGDFESAIPLQREVVEQSREVLGPEHVRTLNATALLASLHKAVGRPLDALELYRGLVEIGERTLGPDDRMVVEWVLGVGASLSSAGRFEEAEPWLERAYRTLASLLAPDHPALAQATGHLANHYSQVGRLEEAEVLFREALQIEQESGRTIDWIEDSRLLSAVLFKTGRYSESEETLARALDASLETHGDGHPETARILESLGVVHGVQGRLTKAEEYMSRSLDTIVRAFGADSPVAATSRSKLALVYKNQERYDEAAELYEGSLATLRATLGPSHLSTLEVLNNLASLNRARGEWAQSVEQYRELLSMIPEDNPSHASVAATIEEVLRDAREE